MRRIGVLMNRVAGDPEGEARLKAFQQGLEQKGWSDGRNVRLDIRWGEDDAERERRYAKELLALAPDAVLAGGSLAVAAFQQLSHTVPIVFATVADPVGGGFVDNLAHPGGNTTGFMLFEYSLSGKWMELLKQIAPSVTRAAVLRVPNLASGTAEFAAVQATAQTLGVEVSPISVREPNEIERAITSFARTANGGLILTPSASGSSHRDLIIALAARFKLPAVYVYRFDVTGGGLISYGPDATDQYRRAAGYVDRILKGETAADLPVEAPTKYQLVINLKTAKALGLNVPQALQASADELIE
jgi:putative ABC transport system substrate-binding protein